MRYRQRKGRESVRDRSRERESKRRKGEKREGE
jgi:hypothetical protein